MRSFAKTNNVCPSCQTGSDLLSVRLDPFPRDPRAVFVENVCQALIDSRFGPGRTSPLLYHYIRDGQLARPVTRPVIFEITAAGPVPSFTILPDSEIARRYAFAALQQVIHEITEECRTPNVAAPDQNTPPYAARGSP